MRPVRAPDPASPLDVGILARAFAAAALGVALWRRGGGVLWPSTAVVAALLALAAATPLRQWPWLAASARMAVALLAIHAWHGAGWWALAAGTPVVAWRDARRPSYPSRPSLPLVAGLLAAVAWSAYRPGENIWRSIAVAVASALAVALATRSASEQAPDAG